MTHQIPKEKQMPWVSGAAQCSSATDWDQLQDDIAETKWKEIEKEQKIESLTTLENKVAATTAATAAAATAAAAAATTAFAKSL